MPTIHKMEQELRERGAGVYGSKAASAPKNKMAPKPDNKELPALSAMTKAELIAQADAEGVDLSEASNNDERREAIEAARG